MILILKRIPENTRVFEIEDFIQPALKGGFFKSRGRLESLQILQYRLPDSHRLEYHALVRIEPDSAAKRVIKRLNRKRCNGKPINISEYHVRLYSNDRRDVLVQRQPLDRRKSDRRRKDLVIKDITRERQGQTIDYSLLNMKD